MLHLCWQSCSGKTHNDALRLCWSMGDAEQPDHNQQHARQLHGTPNQVAPCLMHDSRQAGNMACAAQVSMRGSRHGHRYRHQVWGLKFTWACPIMPAAGAESALCMQDNGHSGMNGDSVSSAGSSSQSGDGAGAALLVAGLCNDTAAPRCSATGCTAALAQGAKRCTW